MKGPATPCFINLLLAIREYLLSSKSGKRKREGGQKKGEKTTVVREGKGEGEVIGVWVEGWVWSLASLGIFSGTTHDEWLRAVAACFPYHGLNCWPFQPGTLISSLAREMRMQRMNAIPWLVGCVGTFFEASSHLGIELQCGKHQVHSLLAPPPVVPLVAWLNESDSRGGFRGDEG